MRLLRPVSETARGMQAYIAGVRWLKAHPRYLWLLTIPWSIGLIFLVGGITLFSAYDDVALGFLLFARPEGPWYLLMLYYLCKVLLYVAMIVLVFVSSLLLVNILAAPVYETISLAVERDMIGQEPPSLGAWGSAKAMLAELKKVLLILGISILLLCIPGVNVISTLSAAFLVGWDFFDYPLARRGWPLGARLRLVSGEFWAVLGLGLWLVIPLAQLVMMPLAVAGGTMLNLEALKRRELLTHIKS